MGVSWSGQEPPVLKAPQRWGDFFPFPVQSVLGWVLGYNIQRTKQPLSSRSGHFELQEVVLNMESCEERKEKKRTS